eukprot:8508749-Pyramimonas_sp.AAC.1
MLSGRHYTGGAHDDGGAQRFAEEHVFRRRVPREAELRQGDSNVQPTEHRVQFGVQQCPAREGPRRAQARFHDQ